MGIGMKISHPTETIYDKQLHCLVIPYRFVSSIFCWRSNPKLATTTTSGSAASTSFHVLLLDFLPGRLFRRDAPPATEIRVGFQYPSEGKTNFSKFIFKSCSGYNENGDYLHRRVDLTTPIKVPVVGVKQNLPLK